MLAKPFLSLNQKRFRLSDDLASHKIDIDPYFD